MFELPTFQDHELLLRALTHPSYANEHPEDSDNQRLEYLGDCVLGFIVGAMLYEEFPNLKEGELTRQRSILVDEPSLAKLANELKIGEQLRVGKGADLEGIRKSSSVLSDAFEAVIGAYFLDSGIIATQKYVEKIFYPLINSMNMAGEQLKIDTKSVFQQWVFANASNKPPEYRIVDESGFDHAKTFTAEVYVNGKKYGVGLGRSKQEAQKRAAASALRKLGII